MSQQNQKSFGSADVWPLRTSVASEAKIGFVSRVRSHIRRKRALRLLQNAISHVTDLFVTADSGNRTAYLDAVAILLALNRAVYYGLEDFDTALAVLRDVPAKISTEPPEHLQDTIAGSTRAHVRK